MTVDREPYVERERFASHFDDETAKNVSTLSHNTFVKSRGEISRRTPVVLHFLSFPGKKGNEAKERNRRQGKIRLYSGGAAARP